MQRDGPLTRSLALGSRFYENMGRWPSALVRLNGSVSDIAIEPVYRA